MGILIVVGILVLILLIWVGIYNKLVKQRNWVDEAFSQIDVQLRRRNDLIPNLVNTVKGYAKHESSTLEAVTQARQQLVNLPKDASPAQVNQESNNLSGALSRLLVVAEQYPDLKANTNFTQLQKTLEDIEKQIATARQLFNSSAAQYNTTIQSVPNNIVANVHNFTKKDLLETPEEAKAVPNVSFD